MSISRNDVNSDIHTGRVVFVDSDMYENNEDYKAKIDKYVEEGFFRSDEFGSGGGGSASPLAVNISNDTLDKTWQDIYDAFPNAYVITGAENDITKRPIIRIVHNSTGYFLELTNFGGGQADLYWTADPSGYPTLD